MPTEQYIKEQLMQKQAQAQASNSTCGAMGLDPCRERLIDRIKSQKYRAEKESRRAGALGELEYLLDKYPDFARILDLLDQIKE